MILVDDENVKSFVLLDRDENGNYLVLAEENYGQSVYYQCETVDELNSADAYASVWSYDPTNVKSVGYYMDNDFLTTGTGVNLPASIKNNILGIKEGTTKPTWKVENVHIDDSIISNNDVSNIVKVNHQKYLNNNYNDIREIQAAVVLPSYTEYMAYKDKIEVNYVDWKGPMTRTTRVVASIKDGEAHYEPYHYYIQTPEWELDKNRICNGGEIDSWTYAQYHVRPMFWLDKDFFKTSKVVATDIGDEVKKQILQYNVADVAGLYTAEELEAIGYTNLPTVTVPEITGKVVVGQPLVAKFNYSSPIGATENGTTIQWYISDSAKGPWAAIEGAITDTFTVNADNIGKYIKVVVTPKDILNSVGARTESNVKLLAEAVLFEVSSDVYFYDSPDESASELTTLNGATHITAEFEILNESYEAVTKTFIIAVYDKNGKKYYCGICQKTVCNKKNSHIKNCP